MQDRSFGGPTGIYVSRINLTQSQITSIIGLKNKKEIKLYETCGDATTYSRRHNWSFNQAAGLLYVYVKTIV